MPSAVASIPQIINTMVTEVPVGATATLNCSSNNHDHNFMFWLFGNNSIIGPDNDYDETKYKYEVLSGALHIKSVSPEESGFYKCVSRRFDSLGIKIEDVEMIVKDSNFVAVDAVKLVAIVVSIIVIITCAVIYFRLRKEWEKYDGRSVVPVDDVEDEDGDGDEIYNRTTTTITQPVPGPSRNQSSDLLYGIDNQGLDTDFNSVFENIQIKSSDRSLI